MSAGIVVFDPSGRVVLSNQAAQRLFDISGERTGKGPLELVRNPAMESVLQAVVENLLFLAELESEPPAEKKQLNIRP